MKYKVYLKIANGGRAGYKVHASTSPDYLPLSNSQYNPTFYPTVAFAVDFNIPDELFKSAERLVAQINIASKEAEIAGDILIPKLGELKSNLKQKVRL
jgi:hypothetical protein